MLQRNGNGYHVPQAIAAEPRTVDSETPMVEVFWTRLRCLQLASIVLPAVLMLYEGLYVIPTMQQTQVVIVEEREKITKHAAEMKAVRSEVRKEQAFLLLDLQESRRMAKSIQALLRNGD